MLTDNQEVFVQELIKGKSQREAYRIAYPNCKAKDKSVDEKASRLFNSDKVKSRYEGLHAEVFKPMEEAAIATAQEVLAEISAVAFGAKTFEVTNVFGEKIEARATVPQRLKALEMLCRKYGLFSDNVNLNGKLDTGNDKLAAILQQLKGGE